MVNPKLVIFLVGPTAVGKSETAAILAKKIGAEIISCDSMQIYQEMDIITSRPSEALRRKAVHHLIGVISPKREYNVSRYRSDALGKIEEIFKRKKIPLFAGGTGFYMSILIDGIFEMKEQNKSIRQKLYREAAEKGTEYLYGRLKKVDPRAASKIHPHDAKRIIRALEVFLGTGKPISRWQKERKGLSNEYAVRIFCLNLARDKLYQKIDARVEKMFRQGLVKEVKRLLKLRLSETAGCAIGIKELKGHFNGLYDLEEAKRLIKRNSRRYAKRQLAWFRKDKRIKRIDVNEKEKPQEIAKRIWKELS